ncbi:Aste57867_17245 [Aphanomyces stellatus]|uniref:Aste57867_17245 protein n=1 Tax=Aphanomyces stellatus TaxID=120398 RepID=A0A485L7B6_9STRA|nr:hypothetical protein As57867_017186 [Aphanomyces stellatus]VFT94001.1 Aste57867_17245 [Aphanomyces stellatus]
MLQTMRGLVALAAISTLLSTPAIASGASDDPFHWQPCSDAPSSPSIQCGFLTVPLNYINTHTNETIDIAVRRVQVPQSKGTILLNPGGPGSPGTSMATPEFASYLGGTHDILGFDPRGVGASRLLRCAPVPLATMLLPMESPETHQVWRDLGDACKAQDGVFMQSMSTASVARDMELIRAALGESTLNYLGISYGTYLGVTYANLFPDRVGQFVLDSNVDAMASTASFFRQLLRGIPEQEIMFQAFVTACEEAGPVGCALADATATRPYVADRIQSFVSQVDATPITLASGDVLTGNVVRFQMRSKPPSQWPAVASQLSEWMAGRGQGLPQFSFGLEAMVYTANDSDDVVDINVAAEMALAKVDSPIFGPFIVGFAWPVTLWRHSTAFERYTGPWNTHLRNPIVLVNNKVDPQTPLRGAQHLAALLGDDNAILVTRDGYGHVALASEPSQCLDRLIVDFFNHGTYPEAGTNCPVDETPFHLPVWPPLPTSTYYQGMAGLVAQAMSALLDISQEN